MYRYICRRERCSQVLNDNASQVSINVHVKTIRCFYRTARARVNSCTEKVCISNGEWQETLQRIHSTTMVYVQRKSEGKKKRTRL
jgi:hypothetical protein